MEADPYCNVPNFHRIVVHGSTFPLEWLKVWIDPSSTARKTADVYPPPRFAWQLAQEPWRFYENLTGPLPVMLPQNASGAVVAHVALARLRPGLVSRRDSGAASNAGQDPTSVA
jgi:hypothetical protein